MKILAIGDFQGELPQKLKNRISKEEFDLIVGVGDYSGIKEFYPFIMDMFKRLKKGKDRITPREFFGNRKLKKLEKKDFEAGKKVLSYLDKLGKPVIAIFGNTDDGWYKYPISKISPLERKKANYLRKLDNIKFVNYSHKKYKNLDFIGFGGYMDIEAFFKKSTFKTQKEIERIPIKKKRHRKMKAKFFYLLKRAYKQKNSKILILHYPPFGVFDIIKNKNNPMDGESAGIKFFRDGIKKYKPLLVLCGHMAEYQGMKKIYGIPIINPGAAHYGKAAIIEVGEGKIKSVKFIR